MDIMNGEESKAEVRELLNRYVSIQRKMVELETDCGSCMKENVDVKKAKGVNHVVRTETA